MGHVFLRRQVHQKLFGRSPHGQDSAASFSRHRRAGDPSSFFKSLLGGEIGLWVTRLWLQLGQTKLTQPFANRALMHPHGEPAGDDLLQIQAAPANDLVLRRIWTIDNQRPQFRLLCLAQAWRRLLHRSLIHKFLSAATAVAS